MGVVETGTDRSRGEIEECRDLRGLVAHVVTEHEDRPLASVEAPKAAVELVAHRDAQEVVGSGRIVERQQAEVRGQPSFPSGLGNANIREKSVDPGVETARIAEVPQITPGDHQRVLQGILGPIDIPEDPVRDCEEAVTARADQVDECRLITVLCRLDEVAIHRLLPAWAPIGDAVHLYRWILRHQRWKIDARTRGTFARPALAPRSSAR